MISPALLYMLVSVALFTVAVVAHFHSASLSLPLSPVTSILAAILPIAGFLNAYIHPTLLRRAHSPSSSRISQLAPLITQVLQALVATILATLLFEHVVPSQGLDCSLDNRWMGMWRARDAEGIRRIQDALGCCGLRTVKDMAYPFVGGKEKGCSEIYGRDVACKGPWRGSVQRASGTDFAVVMAAGLVQIIGLLLMREGTSWWTAWRGWRSRDHRLPNHVYESRRPLLTAAPEDDAETAERQISGYGGTNGVVTDEEEGVGPRVEPSVLNERNAWSE